MLLHFIYRVTSSFMCNCNISKDVVLDIGAPNRIWAIPSVHADVNSLVIIHDQLLEHFQAGDKIIYLGNYTGYGHKPIETLNEILTFRRLILSITGVFPNDVIYLRGAQEEIFEKLWQLHFAPDAENVFLWMLGNGLTATLESCGINTHEALESVRSGSRYMTQWISKTRKHIRTQIDYDTFFINMKRAAIRSITGAPSNEHHALMLFVNSGIDYERNVDEQADAFWWRGDEFDKIKAPYQDFDWVVRGYDPKHRGIFIRKNYATIDNGAGFGGGLICAGIDCKGDIVQYLEAA